LAFLLVEVFALSLVLEGLQAMSLLSILVPNSEQFIHWVH
jgi:hypothetical protein